MNYDDACDAEVTRAEAQREIRKHADDEAEYRGMVQTFDAECGVSDTYAGRVVLDWLGY